MSDKSCSYAGIDLKGRRPLTDGVCAVIRRENDGRLLLQHRDPGSDIPYGDMRCFFGGSIEKNETRKDAILREIHEELRLTLDPEQVKYAMKIDIDLEPFGLRKCFRIYYTVEASGEFLSDAVLGEGQAMEFVDEKEALAPGFMVPYDSYVLWLMRNSGQFFV